MLQKDARTRLRALLIELLTNPESEEHSNRIADEILKLSPDPDILGYIFWPHRYGITRYVNEDIPQSLLVERALENVDRYKPVVL